MTRAVLARALVAVAAVAWIVAAAVLVSGGIHFRFFGILLRARSIVPAIAIAVAATIAASVSCGFRLKPEVSWWWTTMARRASWLAAALAAVTVAIGINWGTFAAGGSDSYCYLNQAELFARGDVHDVEPMAADPAWPGRPISFVPAGHSLVPDAPGALSPICPAGYPALMALARLAGGRTAMFWVTPLAGGLAVWLTFVLARRLGGASAGLLAALMLTTSPIFNYQLVQPMNDVVATAAWTAVLVVVTSGKRPVAAGLLTGLALTIRPNLLPVGVVVGLWVLIRNWKEGVAFGVACIPGIAFVLAAQDAMYGAPLRSGYGDLSAHFALGHVLPNLARYPRWLLSAHTPVLLLALWLPAFRRRQAFGLLAFIAVVFACYLPYVVFEDWWYQRFLLPALPAIFALTAAVITMLLARLALPVRAALFVVLCAAVGILYLNTAARRDAFRLRDHEHRFRAGGEFVATLPPNAAVITTHQSGSVRFYSGRSAITWDEIPQGRLADVIAFLRRHGRDPYLLFEPWEEPEFRKRFAATDPLGALDWPPMVDIDRTVRVYRVEDRDRYMRGERVDTRRVVTRSR